MDRLTRRRNHRYGHRAMTSIRRPPDRAGHDRSRARDQRHRVQGPCLALFKQLEARRYDKVVVTRRGKPIAELTPTPGEVPESYGGAQGPGDHPARSRPRRRRCSKTFRKRSRGKGGSSGQAVVLLDTCAAIWVGNRRHPRPAALEAIRAAAARAELLVSPITGWEIGLATRHRGHPLILLPTPQAWLADLLARPGVRLAPLGPGGCADRLLPARAAAPAIPPTGC